MTKLLALTVSAVLIVLDQLTKAWAMGNLAASIPVIPGLFYLTYVENRGAAFGIFQGKTTLLAIVSIVVLLVLLVAILSGRIKERFLIWAISLVLAGGFGNCIDRLARGFVVDYLDFSALFGFPVFNLADCCVVVGTFLILIYVIFLERKKPQSDEAAHKPEEDGERNSREEI